MDTRFTIWFSKAAQKMRSSQRHTRWEYFASVLFLLAIIVPYYLLQAGLHPPVGLYITIMGVVAAGVALRKDPPVREKAAWILVIVMLTVAEIKNLYVAEHEEAQTFSNIVSGLQRTANGLKETLGESTGGDSFCYVDVARDGPDTLIAHLVRRGRYPVFHVVVSINDVDAYNKGMQSGDIVSSRRTFQPITVIPVFSFWQPLTKIPIKLNLSLQTFTAEIDARNGVFSEVLLVRTLKNGSTYKALIVNAFYLSNKTGIVFEDNDKNFPKELLASSQEWQRFANLKKLKTSTDRLTGQ